MKNYKTPELEMLEIATIGDIITVSFDEGGLGNIGAEGEDHKIWIG